LGARLSLAVLTAGGYLGGKLAYRYGVRVADEETQVERHLPATARQAEAAAVPGRRRQA
jgi:hypothetical protein